MQNTVKASAIVLALALTACSNDNSDQNKTQDAAEETTANATDTQPTAEKEAANMSNEEFKESNVAYLEENKAKDGVQVTESGLQYKVIESGEGPTATASDFVTVHYAGRLIDGSEFDSSYKRGEPATF
ncbi:MAG: FKBP-type peptidyl-prolyl cis-trans isomerase N-terminal domain-containing protein, partial [Kordiimonas sp.]